MDNEIQERIIALWDIYKKSQGKHLFILVSIQSFMWLATVKTKCDSIYFLKDYFHKVDQANQKVFHFLISHTYIDFDTCLKGEQDIVDTHFRPTLIEKLFFSFTPIYYVGLGRWKLLFPLSSRKARMEHTHAVLDLIKREGPGKVETRIGITLNEFISTK